MSKIHLIGNAHLDPIWLWTWQEGCSEVLQTFRSAVDRLNEYGDDGFVFTCSSAAYYKWVEEIDPQLFSEITELIKKEKWYIVNGWWVQPDCNIPCAESFARQALYSQLYYYKKFGKICSVGYNVDSFGHNAMMPQFLVKGGMKCYVMMRPDKNENPEMPRSLFWWDSADGSRVMTYRIQNAYCENGTDNIDKAIDNLTEIANEDGHGMMLFFGVGNHGGGPTKGDIEHIKKLKNDGLFDLEFSNPEKFFKEMCAEKVDIPHWNRELQHHASGCYSVNSLVKKLNHDAEIKIINAEKWNTVASLTTTLPKASDKFADGWKNVCFNQFHDVLCGCSIAEAYDDVKEELGYAMDIASKEQNKAILKICGDINTWIDGVSDSVTCNERHHCQNKNYPRPVVVFNPLSFDAETPVRAYHPSAKVFDSDGKEVLFQNVRSSRSDGDHMDTVFLANVPALGYAVYWLDYLEKTDVTTLEKIDKNDLTLENEHIKAVFNKETGGIISLITKYDNSEYVGGESCVPTVIDNSKPDTWAHNIFKFEDIIGKAKLESIECVEKGDVRQIIRTKHSYNKSYIAQDFVLDAGSELIRVKTRILWQEPLTIVKMPFTMKGENEVSTYQIPGGIIKRGCTGDEEPAQRWGDISVTDCGKRKGVAIISDTKYSYSCNKTTLSLTMLRNSIFADHYSKRPYADFRYTDEGLQTFEYAVYPHAGEAENSKVENLSEVLNSRPFCIITGYHKGDLPQKKSYISISKPNVTLMAMKYCEDGSGDVIIRLRETNGIPVKCAIVCDIVEAGFYADFGKFEIKTFRIDKEGFVTETDFLEGIV